jgi:addiction module RelE/StbE family toxin
MRVIWTPEANQDRLAIQDHIAIDSSRAAVKMDELFLNAAAQLGTFPLLGQPGRIPGTRELIPHENYRLVYQVSDDDDTVWILALVHAARQWPPIITH